MTSIIGVAQINSDNFMHSFTQMTDVEHAQGVADRQNLFNAERGIEGDRWVVAEVREYGVRAKVYRFDIYRQNTDFEQYGADATSPADALNQFFEAWKDEILPEPKENYFAFSHEYNVDSRKKKG